MGMRIFARITKVDQAKREVWGRAVQETPDATDEIFDYVSSKPYFEAWSDETSKRTGGKSLGNLRAMHEPIAAGKLISIDFNDEDKAIDIGTKVVDDAEWDKVLEGVYTGFSIGGKYAKKWADGTQTRYTAKPSEISLVDRPCVPTATFYDVVKLDGSVVKTPFKEKSMTPVAAIDGIVELLNSGAITAPDLLDAARSAVAKAKKTAKSSDDDDDDVDKPDDVSQEDWDAMTPAQQAAAAKAKKDGDGGDAAMADKAAPAGDAAKAATTDDAAKSAASAAPATASAAASDPPAAAAPAAAMADSATSAVTAKVEEPDKASVAAHNAEVEKVAREFAAEAFEKLEPAAKAGAHPERDWANYVPEATREIATRKSTQAQQINKAADDGDAMPDGSYPIKTVADLEKAIQAFGRAKDPDKVKAHIIALAKTLGATDKLPADWSDSTKDKKDGDSKKEGAAGDLKKGLYNVQSFASALQSLAYVFFSAQSDFDCEGDGSPVPAKLRTWIASGAEIFKEMAAEEVDELVACLNTAGNQAVMALAERAEMRKQLEDPALGGDELEAALHKALTADEMKAVTGDALAKGNGKLLTALRDAALAKYGARHSAADVERLQKAHDCLKDMGAECAKADGSGPVMSQDNGNAAAGNTVIHTEKANTTGDLLKLQTQQHEIDTLKKSVGELTTELKKLRDEPARPKGVLRSFYKGEDIATTDGGTSQPVIESTPGKHNPEAAEALIKQEITRATGLRKI
jgi:hypothetical protein